MESEKFITDELKAVRSVILELMEILSDYREHLVLTGGVVPHLLLPPDSSGVYRSTNDVDIVLDLTFLHTLEDDTQDSIHDILFQNLYQQDETKPYRYHKGVWTGTRTIIVPIDLLAGRRYAEADREIHQKVRTVHEIYASPLYGVDIALLSVTKIALNGQLPDGRERHDVPVRVVDLALFPLIKAIAFTDRLEAYRRDPESNHEDEGAKHAFDIYECLSRFPGGLEALAAGIAPHKADPMIQDALSRLYEGFRNLNADGPRLLIREEKYATEPSEVTDFVRQDAFQRVNRLRQLLDEPTK
jgi:hypothetical protein